MRKQREKVRLNELKQGDIVYAFTLFEENTKDYYNGHKPETVRPDDVLMWNERKQTYENGKFRPIYILEYDASKSQIVYCPVSSSFTNIYDSEFQELVHLTNMNRPISAIETGQVRTLDVEKHWSFEIMDRVQEDENQRVIERIEKHTFEKLSYAQKNSEKIYKDEHGYIQPKNQKHVISTYRMENIAPNQYQTELAHKIIQMKNGHVFIHHNVPLNVVKQIHERNNTEHALSY